MIPVVIYTDPHDGDSHFRHVQAVPLTVWVVEHGLGKHPSVSVVDSAGTVVYGEVRHQNEAVCVLTFSAPFAGEAYFN